MLPRCLQEHTNLLEVINECGSMMTRVVRITCNIHTLEVLPSPLLPGGSNQQCVRTTRC